MRKLGARENTAPSDGLTDGTVTLPICNNLVVDIGLVFWYNPLINKGERYNE